MKGTTSSSVPEPGPASSASGRQLSSLSAQVSHWCGITPYHQNIMKKANPAAAIGLAPGQRSARFATRRPVPDDGDESEDPDEE